MSEKQHFVNIQIYDSAIWLVIDGSGVLIDRDAVSTVIGGLLGTLELTDLREVQKSINQAIQSRVVKVEGPRYATWGDIAKSEGVKEKVSAASQAEVSARMEATYEQRKLEEAYDAERQHRPIVKK